MRCRCSISRSRRRGRSPSSPRTSSTACGSAVLPFGLPRTLRFMQTGLSARPRRAILDCGQVDSPAVPRPSPPPRAGDLAGMAGVKCQLAPHVKAEFLSRIRGTADSEWIYALSVSQLQQPSEPADEAAVFEAIEKTLAVLRKARERLGIALSSSVNLFIANGSQLAAVRYCFDFGCYRTDDPARVHEANLTYLSLWYTLGRDYGLHDGECE